MGRVKDILKHSVGWLAERAIPELATEIDEARNTARAPMLKRCILQARLQRAKVQGDEGAVEKTLAAFWKGNTGDVFFSKHSDARFKLFCDQHFMVIDALREFLEGEENEIHRLVEIGCGEGRALIHCFEQMPAISSAVGLDINAAVVARNSAEHNGKDGVSFVHSDGINWLEQNPMPGTVLFFNGGVLEYFSPESFDKILRLLAGQPPSALVLIEPVAPDHDLEKEVESKVFGYENSFSHNHRYRLNKAGFEILHCTELKIGAVRWMLILAEYHIGPKQ